MVNGTQVSKNTSSVTFPFEMSVQNVCFLGDEVDCVDFFDYIAFVRMYYIVII
jgi:hypothetical protein